MYLTLDSSKLTSEEIQQWLDGTCDKHDCELVTSHAAQNGETAFVFRRQPR